MVGGGFAGLSAALHLAEYGAAVSLVEANEIGFGASGRNGGQANPGLKLDQEALTRRFGETGKALFQLGEEAVDFLASLIFRKKLRCQFVQPGLVRLAHLPSAMRALDAVHKALNARGIQAKRLSLQDIETIVGTKRYCGGLLDPRGGSLHPLDLARELARVAVEAGAKIYAHSRATALQKAGDRWRVVCPTGNIIANAIAFTTNAYTDDLLPNLARSILPVNSFQIATEPLKSQLTRGILPDRHAVYDSRRLVLYFRKSPDDRIMLGGRASFDPNSDVRSDLLDYDVLVRTLHGIFPQLKGIPVSYRWTGLVCITPDHLPHYHSPRSGLHVALGFNGRGVAMATRTGAWLARKILGKSDTGDIPHTEIGTIPFHAWRAPVLNLIMKWNRFMDFIGA